MKAAFGDDSGFTSVGCLIHSLQLVIKTEVIEFPAVKAALDKARKICTHANKSTIFCSELRRQERLQGMDEKVLIQDVPTRWDSTFNMGDRFVELKPAIIASMATLDTDLAQLSSENWNYLKKAVEVLRVFKEATVMLSSSNASISQAIFVVTVILAKLKKVTSADHGVIQLKRALTKGMEERFASMETLEMYALATYLDPRYKGFLFRKQENAFAARQKIAEKLEELLNEDPSFHDMEEQDESSMVLEAKMPKKAKTLSDTKAEIIKKSIFAQQSSASMEVQKFLEEYSNSKLMEEDDNIFEYWKNMSKSTKPIERVAAKLAEYYLTPPPSSVDVERLFSTAGDILSVERNRLLPDNAAKLLFLRENLPRVNYVY